jgi:FlaA1/EpsC-like NDP-sugar epimerase
LLYNIAISLTRSQKRFIILSADIILIGFSYILATFLLSGEGMRISRLYEMRYDLAVLLLVGTLMTVLLGLHRIKLNAYEMQGVVESAFVAVILTISGVLLSMLATNSATAPHVYVVFGMLFLILSVANRLLMRAVLLWIYRRGSPSLRLMIYGAGQTGQQLAAALATDNSVQPMVFVDDNQRLHSLSIAGLRVNSPAMIPSLIKDMDIDRIVLAMPSASPKVQADIIGRLSEFGCEVHALPSFADLVANTAASLSDTKPVDLNTLLGRDQMVDELPGVADTYQNRSILITGAGGSIGSELCRQLLSCRPARLVILDHSEWSLFEIDRELRSLNPEFEIVPVLGSVTDKALISEVISDNSVDIILHAAAYKHVPLVEGNTIEGMRNNVFGTKCVAEAAREAGIERFILVSTDKAVRPSSIMGASKRFAELLIQDLATRSANTRFSMVRFGNVLGSSGSVIPLFEEQIAKGGPITLTHKDMTRFFMTIPEAVQLVLLAGSFARGGDVFVLDMGKPVPIGQVARQLIEGAGLSVRDAENPEGDIEIRITGLRPGEKLHEELLIGTDMLTTPHAKILRAQEERLSEIEMAKALKSLHRVIDARDKDQLMAIVAQWIEQSPPMEEAIINE